MKSTQRIISMALLMAAVTATSLTACTASESPQATTAADVYTSVAQTVAAASSATPVPPTATETAANTATPTITLIATETLIPSNTAAVSSNAATACDNSAYVSDVSISDGTIIEPGASFTKTWQIMNTGTCTWSTSYQLAFLQGSQMSGDVTALSDDVAPNGSIQISVEMVAPTSTGTYTGYWQMQNASGVNFGQSIYVQIVVDEDAATATATSAITNTPTTAANTATEIPIATDAPTAAPTVTPEPSSTTAPTLTTEPTEA